MEEEFDFENPQIEVNEIENADANAEVVAKSIADWLEKGGHAKRVGYTYLRRMKEAGAIGAEIEITGKLSGNRGRTEKFSFGYVKRCGNTSKDNVQKGYELARTKPGAIGVKVRIMKEMPDFLHRDVDVSEEVLHMSQKTTQREKTDRIEEVIVEAKDMTSAALEKALETKEEHIKTEDISKDEVRDAFESIDDMEELEREVEERAEELAEEAAKIAEETGEELEEDAEALEEEVEELEEEQKESDLQERVEDLDSRLSGLEIDEPEEISVDTEGEIDELRNELAQAETHETERIDSLASRVEKLELDLQNESVHEKAAQQRVKKLEEKVEKLEDSHPVQERLSELEDDMVDFSENINDRIDSRIDEKVGNRLEKFDSRLRSVEDHIKDVMEDMKELADVVKERN